LLFAFCILIFDFHPAPALNPCKIPPFTSDLVDCPPHPPFTAEHLSALLRPRPRPKPHLPQPLNPALAMIFH
jgi:hypothetical protein